jgi:hypothetical protein
MKHWQFYIAILILAFLLVPTYEGNVSVSTPKIANIPNGNYVIKIGNNVCYSTADGVICDNSFTGTLYIATFYIQKLPEIPHGIGAYAIKNKKPLEPDSRFCSSEWNRILCNRTGVQNQEVFFIIDAGNGFYNIRPKRQGTFCNIRDNAIRCWAATTAGETEKFQIIPETEYSSSILENTLMPIEASMDNIKNKEFSQIKNTLTNINNSVLNLENKSDQSENEINKYTTNYRDLKNRQGVIANRVLQSESSIMNGLTMLHDINDKIINIDGQLINSESRESVIRNDTVPELKRRARNLSGRLDYIENKREPELYDRSRIAKDDLERINNMNSSNKKVIKHNNEVWNL